jgi:hypothetical protein
MAHLIESSYLQQQPKGTRKKKKKPKIGRMITANRAEE